MSNFKKLISILLCIMMLASVLASCDTAEPGPQGEQGIQGEKGEQGIQGEQGEKGDKGDENVIDTDTQTNEGTNLETNSESNIGETDNIVAQYTEGLIFKLDSDGYIVSGYTGTATDVIIPAMHNGKAVTRISSYAFPERDHITSVTIQNGIRAINDYAFYGCVNLASIMVPDSVESVTYLAIKDTAYYKN